MLCERARCLDVGASRTVGLMSARFALLSILLLGCGGAEPTLLDDPLAPFPERLSGLGLYPDPADPDTASDQVIAYAPRHSFWSNGAAKDRFLAAPAPIDMSDPDAWGFPVGTLLFKTFRFPGAAAPTETRVLRRGEERWEYAAYRWRDGEPEGDLLDLAEPVPAPVTVDGEAFDHLIPSRFDCRTCHEAAPVPVLGYAELALAEIEGETELETEVLGYLAGNCAYCHDGTTGPANGFDLRPAAALDSMICHETNESHTAAGYRIVPGDPAASVLFLAVSGETDDPEVKAMPPVGVQHRDAAGIELLRAWIESLEGECE